VQWVGRHNVPLCLDRVVALKGLHHAPDTVGGGREVVGNKHLARSTTMYCSALNLKCGLASWRVGAGGVRIGHAILAGKVGATGVEGGLRLAVDDPLGGILHHQMSGGGGKERGKSGDGS